MAEYLRRNQRSNLTYVVYQHQLALSSLSSDIPLPTALEYPEHCHLVAKDALNCNGWIWPAILDAQFPSPSDGGLMYSFTKIEYVPMTLSSTFSYPICISGHPCLRLLNPDEKPTARQEHALKVLTYTFSVLTMSPSPAARNAPPQPISIPPHVNQLLQQMGLPPLRFANNHVQAVANQNNPALREIREIQIRPLIAPLMMLFLRTGLLLYFVAPARKPIFSILIFAWMLYEIWHPIRNVLRNRLGPIGQGQQQERNNGVGAGGAEQAENNNAPPADLGQNAGLQPNIPVRPNALDQQFESIMDSLANVNVANEERFLNSTSAVPPPEPSIGHKSLTFIGLLLSTIHPAIWNRRRVALRRREGTVRTEANARNAPVEPEGDEPGSNSSNQPENIAQIREELRARLERQPLWIQRYVQRVINEDWVDDLD